MHISQDLCNQNQELYHTKQIMRDDTICAVATAIGGAIAIIRVSGPEAISATDRIFSKPLSQAGGQTLHYGWIIAPAGGVEGEGEVVDEVMVSVFRAPHSYTGEDATEISCHGSRYIVNRVMQLLIEGGCRQALGGEFTQRAFLAGKLDLSQAEAVADLIASSNRAAHHTAMNQLRGSVSTELATLRDQLLRMTSLLELELDFSDHEELEFADRSELQQLSHTILAHLQHLASTFAAGSAIKEGIPVAIVGKTNVGKSTLLNQLVGEERAIVSSVHGTTRDVIEDCITIEGICFRMIDTAGLRSTTDEVEQIGIGRTFRKLSEASIVLWVVDEVPTPEEVADMENRCRDKQLIIVNNKTDIANLTPTLRQLIASHKDGSLDIIGISARQGESIPALRQAILRAAHLPDLSSSDAIISSARHYDALRQAEAHLSRVIEGLDSGLSGDLLSEDLRLCLHSLGEITGQETFSSSAVLENIFSHFCVGK